MCVLDTPETKIPSKPIVLLPNGTTQNGTNGNTTEEDSSVTSEVSNGTTGSSSECHDSSSDTTSTVNSMTVKLCAASTETLTEELPLNGSEGSSKFIPKYYL